MLKLDVLELAIVDLVDDLVPQHAGLHHVTFFHRGELVAPGAGELKSDTGNTLDLVGVVDLRVDSTLLAVAEICDGFGLAEINTARQLAHDHEVEAVDDLALEARRVGERGIADCRAQVGEEAKVLAQSQKSRFWPRI